MNRMLTIVLALCLASAQAGPAFMPESRGSLAPPRLPGASVADLSEMSSASKSAVLSLRGGVNAEVSDIVVSAYDWCINLGAPSALVAGAVIATIYENIGSGALEVRSKDSSMTKFLKRFTRVLLLSSFALEVMAIFVTTVTGTMLLSRTLDYMDEIVPVSAETTPLAFLRSNFEFEYLTARIAFLQGLINWVVAIGICHIIPNANNATRKMNKFIASSLFTVVMVMMAFYNNHMTFYDNYWGMLQHWFQVTIKRYVFHYPPRPMVYLIAPSIAISIYWGFQAFFNSQDEEDDDFDAIEY
mmetsp:Transcript_8503/g.17648  ORF Transcript_8503/g.17648 Transcript_8503/m.17648 type:complete len:300 (-) Transcript_8503:186-1085(-)|eukprot:CAMPEP_0172443980 /NCGR_PEP_ID=MMETSP1065-20121228/4151_1 /TAXON_ID=265537 /ORGANISM="Amphiprora paludosa, Strain CCMP125" /LENGTH=299 /DNA_ID=CAMNT_0013194397 /DNA_START=52 /DNA_END=951 /DNA_ORIENTATION=-